MTNLTLNKIEKILTNIVKKHQESATNVRVVDNKNKSNQKTILVDIKHPDLIAKEDHKKWEECSEFSGWVEWKKGDNLKLKDELNKEWISFGLDKFDRVWFSVDGLAGKDHFYDSTGYGVINDKQAYYDIQKEVAELGFIFEPSTGDTGVLETAYKI